MLRVVLIGLGSMGKNHARVLSNISGVQLKTIVDPVYTEKESSFNCEIARTLGQVDLSQIDYAVIAAPTSKHHEIALELIHSGIPFLIEKPLAGDSKSAIDIANHAREKNLRCGVGHIERFNAAVIQAKVRIQNGQIGEIFQITTVRQGPFPQRISDVGVTFDLATHDIDITAWLTESHYKNVSSQAAHHTGRMTEDLIHVNGSLDSGVLINHQVNWLSPNKTRAISILGERGVLHIDTLSSDLTFFENGKIPVLQEKMQHFSGVTQGEVTKYSFEKPEPLLTEHQAFRDYVQGIQEDFITLEEGSKTVAVAEAILKSARENSTFNFPR